MRNEPNDIRCEGCGILLAKREGPGLSIRRGELQATIQGTFHASLVCYRPRCRRLNVLRVPDAPVSSPGAA